MTQEQEREAYQKWFRSQQGVTYDGMWAFAMAAWQARAALAAPAQQYRHKGNGKTYTLREVPTLTPEEEAMHTAMCTGAGGPRVRPGCEPGSI